MAFNKIVKKRESVLTGQELPQTDMPTLFSAHSKTLGEVRASEQLQTQDLGPVSSRVTTSNRSTNIKLKLEDQDFD